MAPVQTNWSSEGNILTILAGPTVGAIPAGGVLNIADLAGEGGNGDDLWFDTTTNAGGVGSSISVTVDDYGTSSNFTGASRAASVATTLLGPRVWTTLS